MGGPIGRRKNSLHKRKSLYWEYYENELRNVFFQFVAGRLAVITFGVVALIAGLILSSVPWVHYIILKVYYFL